MMHLPLLLLLVYDFQSLLTVAEDKSPNSDVASPHLVIVIISQPHPWHEQRALALKENILNQAKHLKLTQYPEIFISHLSVEESEEEKVVSGHWAVWPLLKSIIHHSDVLGHGTTEGTVPPSEHYWLFVCEEETRVDLDTLVRLLADFDPSVDQFIGRGLVDKAPTIIHHYAFAEDSRQNNFHYPDFSAGLLVSSTLVEKLVENVVNMRSDFVIDAKHELAMTAWQKGLGTVLNQHSGFCLTPEDIADRGDDCVTEYHPVDVKSCAYATSEDDVLFAVKTFSGYHKTRIVVVKRTWAKTARNIEYYSDTYDQYVPTVEVPLPNTERGHCSKTWFIFKRFLEDEKWAALKWLVVVDDDTLISVSRLTNLLRCYNANDSILIGERYGYGFDTDGAGGYDYPTGGAGMAFTRSAVATMVADCGCPNNDSPDDMMIGICAVDNGVIILHSPAFHQARPEDYAKDYLRKIRPISFHKHWETDPYRDYRDFLHDEPSSATQAPSPSPVHQHQEL